MFKNEKSKLEALVEEHAKGEIFIPTELEEIMYEEARDQIRRKYDHNLGAEELYVLIKRT